MVKNADAKMLILSMEGGGVKGIAQAEFLTLLENEIKKPVPQVFDFFSGASIGGIHALIFAMDRQYHAGKLLDLYTKERLKRIFRKNFFSWLNPSGIWYPKYKRTQKPDVLAEVFQEQRLSDVLKPVMVSAYDYINAEACYFSTYSKKKSTLELYAKDAADATSAAPTYFPPIFIKSENSYFLDGGLISNNPCLAAFVEALKNGYSPSNIKILSIAVGSPSMMSLKYGKQSVGWGFLKWITKGKLLQKIFEAPTQSAVHQCEKILNTNFMHISFDTVEGADTDNISPKILNKLKDAAKRKFESVSERVIKFISKD